MNATEGYTSSENIHTWQVENIGPCEIKQKSDTKAHKHTKTIIPKFILASPNLIKHKSLIDL